MSHFVVRFNLFSAAGMGVAHEERHRTIGGESPESAFRAVVRVAYRDGLFINDKTWVGPHLIKSAAMEPDDCDAS